MRWFTSQNLGSRIQQLCGPSLARLPQPSPGFPPILRALTRWGRWDKSVCPWFSASVFPPVTQPRKTFWESMPSKYSIFDDEDCLQSVAWLGWPDRRWPVSIKISNEEIPKKVRLFTSALLWSTLPLWFEALLFKFTKSASIAIVELEYSHLFQHSFRLWISSTSINSFHPNFQFYLHIFVNHKQKNQSGKTVCWRWEWSSSF